MEHDAQRPRAAEGSASPRSRRFRELLTRIGERLRRDPYAQAAVAYFLYALIYLAGAIALLGPERQRSFGRIPWWFFYAAGAAMVVALPAVMWMRSRIGTAILGALVTLRVLMLLPKIRDAATDRLATIHAAFAGIAALTAVLLWRAVLSRQERPAQ